MNNDSFYLAWLVMSLLLLCNASVGLTDEAKVVSTQDSTFFTTSVENGFEPLAVYGKMPDDEDVLPRSSYAHIVRQFDWWIRKAIKSKYVPEVRFVVDNIKLLPANDHDREEDLAFLSYEISGKTFMIVQSGGLNARMWIFIRDISREKVRDDIHARGIAQDVVDEYITYKFREHIPAFDIVRTKKPYIAKVRPLKGQKGINHAKCFFTDSDICFSIQKISFEDTLPAREPMPNQWFSWWKDK